MHTANEMSGTFLMQVKINNILQRSGFAHYNNFLSRYLQSIFLILLRTTDFKNIFSLRLW